MAVPSLPAVVSAGDDILESWGDSVRENLSFLQNPPACRVYHSVNQSAGDGSFVTLAFNSERFDTDTMHDTVTNNSRITFNTAGLYEVSFNGQLEAGTYIFYQARIFINATSPIAGNSGENEAGAGPLLSCGGLYKFAAGDFITVEVYQDNAASAARNVLVTGNLSPEFSAVWVGIG